MLLGREFWLARPEGFLGNRWGQSQASEEPQFLNLYPHVPTVSWFLILGGNIASLTSWWRWQEGDQGLFLTQRSCLEGQPIVVEDSGSLLERAGLSETFSYEGTVGSVHSKGKAQGKTQAGGCRPGGQGLNPNSPSLLPCSTCPCRGLVW